MKNAPKICAVIEIGTKNVNMGIFQNGKNGIKCLDRLSYPVILGHEIFHLGHVTYSSLCELCAILERYKVACTSFGVEEIRVVSTSVMREAENRALIADRIQTQNKLTVETLADSGEKSLIYSEIISQLHAVQTGINRAVIAYVGFGSIGLACYENGCITRSYSLPTGALKLYDILSSMNSEMGERHLIMEEYLHSIFARIDLTGFDALILTGTEIERITNLCCKESKGSFPKLSADALKNLYTSLRMVTPENIAVRLGIDEESANVLSTALGIYGELLHFAGDSAKIYAPGVDLELILSAQVLTPGTAAVYRKHLAESSVQAAKSLASKYKCDPAHYQAVGQMVRDIFDKLKKVHGLDEHYRSILEIAAILHGCGRYVNVRQQARCSFDLIKNMDIYGMSQEDVLLVAFVSGYNEFSIPDSDDKNYRVLSDTDRIVIAKLVAMFRLANALDKSQKSKITIEKIKVEDASLTIRVSASENCALEQWAFNECADFFRETFGIKPELLVKSSLI